MLEEQDLGQDALPPQPGVAPNAQQAQPGADTGSVPIEPPQASAPTIDENEKYIIKILINAFIFNPNLFDENKRNYIFAKIDEIKRMVNVPVSKVITEIKKIISLDRSLRIESKTLNLLNRYALLLEQPVDATEIQEPVDANTNPEPIDNSELNLAEIFNPLYKQLILKALKHIPTDEELLMIKPIVSEFADSNPEQIVSSIENILGQSLEDKDLEDKLPEIKTQDNA